MDPITLAAVSAVRAIIDSLIDSHGEGATLAEIKAKADAGALLVDTRLAADRAKVDAELDAKFPTK